MVETGMICPDCDGLISFCDHALKRLTDPVLAYQGKVIGELQDDLAEQRARADAALMALAEMREALKEYGGHFTTPPCPAGSMAGDCTCGLSAILAQPVPERGAALLAAADAMADEILNAGMKACPDVLAMYAKARAWRALGRGG